MYVCMLTVSAMNRPDSRSFTTYASHISPNYKQLNSPAHQHGNKYEIDAMQKTQKSPVLRISSLNEQTNLAITWKHVNLALFCSCAHRKTC